MNFTGYFGRISNLGGKPANFKGLYWHFRTFGRDLSNNMRYLIGTRGSKMNFRSTDDFLMDLDLDFIVVNFTGIVVMS